MKNVVAVSALLALASSHALAAVDIAQKPNSFDRSFERLPNLRLVRGAHPKDTTLVVTAEADEAWSVSTVGAWMTVTPSQGTGPAELSLRFDADALNGLEDPQGSITITGAVDPGTNTRTVDVRWDIWPDLVNPQTRAELIAYAKDRSHWPKDGFDGAWELWGFLPDETTHPGRNSGANIDAWEKTPCAPGTSGPDCVRDGQAGLAAGQSADQAWLLSTGDPRIVIGELDSGIRWSEGDLINKFYMNAAELRGCAPPGADLTDADPFVGLDVNGDGLFNIRDFDRAPWVTDVNGNGRRDPQDIIWGNDGDGPCSDGIDDDANGYVDDIAGWDFFWNDNDPSDDSDFGHGTGEANDSSAEAHDGGGGPGVCPRCLVMPVRVGDSFIVDVNQFADATVFVVDSGADVVQEALGSINFTSYAQAAIDYAYKNNVPIVASAADETSYHHNMPGNGEHTMYVHAIQFDDNNPDNSTTFLNFNNCTNFGGHLMLSTPGTGCSSEATGKTAGQVGLFMSYYLQQRDRATGDAAAYFAHPLTTEEVYQSLIASADDIDVPGAETDAAAKELRKFESNEGWDLHFGYGRNNARRSLEVIRDQLIPPEVNVSAPRWFQVVDPTRTSSIAVEAQVGSARLTDLRWEVYVAEGVVPAADAFVKIGEGTGAIDGKLADISLAADGPLGGLVARAAAQAGADPEQFSATVVVKAFGKNPAGVEVLGQFRKTFGVRADETTREGFPIYLGASGESSPKLTDLDGDGREEIVLVTSDGHIHAIRDDGTELAGFPATTGVYATVSDEVCAASPAKCHKESRAFKDGHIDRAGLFQAVNATVAVGDLDGDGALCRDVVVATLDGLIYSYDCHGALRAGFPTTIDRSTTPDGLTGARRCTRDGVELIGCRDEQLFNESGFFSSPVLVDLDKDGSLEIVLGGLDSRAYAFHGTDGTLVAGWPVHLVNPNEPAYDDDGELNRLDDRIVATPTVADLFGDGTPMVVMGTNERILNSNGVFLYAIWPDGTLHDGGAFPPGWPAIVNGFIPEEILPFVGRGNPNSPCSGDLDGDGKDEIVNAGMGGLMLAIQEDGTPAPIAMGSTNSQYGENANVDEAASLPVINNPSVADLDGDGRLEIINGTAGTGLIAVASEGGKRSDFDHSVSAWVADNGFFQQGFPHRVWDYQFFMNYAVADIDGNGTWNVLSGDGGYFVYAPGVDGVEAPGFPKYTQNWDIVTPAIGDLDGDQLIDVVVNTREGWLWAWKTQGHVGGPPTTTLPAIQWEGFHRDDQNTGNASGKFASLKQYPRLGAPQDDVCDEACCCQSVHPASSSGGSSPLPGVVAIVLLLGTLVAFRRRSEA